MQLSSFKEGLEFLRFDVSVQALRTLCWPMSHFHAVLSHSILRPATELQEWSPLLSDFSKNVDAVIALLFRPLVVSAYGILSNCSQNELTQKHSDHNYNKLKKKNNHFLK